MQTTFRLVETMDTAGSTTGGAAGADRLARRGVRSGRQVAAIEALTRPADDIDAALGQVGLMGDLLRHTLTYADAGGQRYFESWNLGRTGWRSSPRTS